MPKLIALLLVFTCLTPGVARAAESEQPNVLYLLTDDQRYDSIRAFNRMLHGRDHSALGYVESPHVDRLAEMGTTFINTYCHATGCAPSRASIHYGRYPHRSGLYEFEYHNPTLPHWRPSMPESMKELGYQTFHVGKLGVRIKGLRDGKATRHDLYEQDISFHKMWREGITDWGKGDIKAVDGQTLPEPTHADWFFSSDGVDYSGKDLDKIPGFEGHSEKVDKKYDIIRMYNDRREKAYGGQMILGGVSPQPAGLTRDGRYNIELARFLQNPGEKLAVGSQKYVGVDPTRPLFAHLGYDFPHTPVLPPKSFRDRFLKETYVIPAVDESESASLPPQLKNLVSYNGSDHFTDAEKQQMVQDYYAFCAYGDDLVGQAADDFIAYSETQGQPWMVVYICGDHGWKLNEHGAVSKFSPWDLDSHNPIIVIASDKKAFPAGKVVTDFAEFVDVMPTVLAAGGADLAAPEFAFLDGYDLAQVASGALPPRPYVLGESHAVIGPRATIRTKDYMFSVRNRPDKKHGRDFKWALNADYEDLEPVLYDTKSDPAEVNNVAFDPAYREVAEALKHKLLPIVLGDGRVEVDWEKWGAGTTFYTSDFAQRADDKQLELP